MLSAIKEFFFGKPKPVEVQVPEHVAVVNAQPIVKEVVVPVTAPAPAPVAKPQAVKKPRQQKPSGAPKARKPKAPK